MRIYYLDNSGFAIILKNTTLIFDYYNDRTEGDRTIESGVMDAQTLKENNKTYVFSSHSHFDHFNRCVLSWSQINPSVKYIFDNGIMPAERRKHPEITFLKEGEIFDDGHIWMKAYGSTDIGISFMVKAEGYTVFHAGDFNLWHWENEADDAFIAKARENFLNILERINHDDYNINIMFFPVDYRMGENGDIGAIEMLEVFQPQIFIPMHFHGEFGRIKAFRQRHEKKDIRIWDIQKRGDVLHLV